jgi:hypothetical protein
VNQADKQGRTALVYATNQGEQVRFWRDTKPEAAFLGAPPSLPSSSCLPHAALCSWAHSAPSSLLTSSPHFLFRAWVELHPAFVKERC